MSPTIRSRTQWGAIHARGAGPAPLPAEFLYLHHTVYRGSGDRAVRDVEQIGQDRFGAGISYTFPIDQRGIIYEGHGIDRKGTHTKHLNSKARAIVAIGNFEEDEPTPVLLEAIAQLVAHGFRQGWWPDRLTGGHRDAPGASTACPGYQLYACITDINNRAAEILAGSNPALQPKDWLMALSDQQQTDLYNWVKELREEVILPKKDGKTRLDRMAADSGANRAALTRLEEKH